MDRSSGRQTLAQARILWWMATTGEQPAFVDGRASWDGGHHSTRCEHGLGRPYLSPSAIAAMVEAELIESETESYDSSVVALPNPGWTSEQKFLHARLRANNRPTLNRKRRLIGLTEKGRAAAPAAVPYPWRPNLNGLTDITRNEDERLRKAEAFRIEKQYYALEAAGAPVKPEAAAAPEPLPPNVIAVAFRQRR